MSKLYTDYINRTALTVPTQFIDVKSGETLTVSSEVLEQIEYHAENQTLIHFVLSALTEYLHPKKKNGSNPDILLELTEIKQMLLQEYQKNPTGLSISKQKEQLKSPDLDLKEVEDILDVFGG